MELTISLWRQKPLKWDAAPLQKLFVICRFAFEKVFEMALDDICAAIWDGRGQLLTKIWLVENRKFREGEA
jgi:hypothetical protein